MLRTVIRVCLLVASLAFLASNVFAQYGSSLQGVITDQSGAAVANAKVTATNQATHVSRDTVSIGSLLLFRAHTR
jgi:hypothetical protein